MIKLLKSIMVLAMFLFIFEANRSFANPEAVQYGEVVFFLDSDYNFSFKKLPSEDVVVIRTNKIYYHDGSASDIYFTDLRDNKLGGIILYGWVNGVASQQFCIYDVTEFLRGGHLQHYCTFSNVDNFSTTYLNPRWSGSVIEYDEAVIDNADYIDNYTAVYQDVRTFQMNIDGTKKKELTETKSDPFLSSALSRGYISGYPDGTLGLSNSVTRAELAKMLTLAFAQGTGTLSSLSKYPDRPTDSTLAPHLARLQELGIMNGYADGYIRPNQSVTIGEALKMTTRVSYPQEVFSDPKNLTLYLEYMKKNFSLLSFLSKSIDSPMTRGEVVEMIETILEKQGK